jgi:predicted nucleotide-binding protein
VFLVHGHDDAAKNAVALFLRAIGLEPIILHQRPNDGRHLLSKFREESEPPEVGRVAEIGDYNLDLAARAR